MKMTKRVLSLVIMSALIFGMCAAFSGCAKPADGTMEINTNKTQMYVFSYNGGVGNDWLDATIAAFKAKYANTSFEEGKMGVQIIPDKQKITAVSMVDSFPNSTYDVIFNENLRYNEWAAKGNLLDLTDLVKETGDDGKTIESKLSENKAEALTARDGKYYALPYLN